MLTHSVIRGGELIDDSDNGGSMGGDDVYIGSGDKIVLASLSNLYSELDAISVDTSGLFFCSTLYCLLTTFNLRKEYIILV